MLLSNPKNVILFKILLDDDFGRNEELRTRFILVIFKAYKRL